MEDAEFGVWRAGSAFTPPFQVTLAPFGQGQDEGALLHMAVTHMLSDGYSVVPLLNDLAHLVTQAEREAQSAELGSSAPAPESAAVLPPLPSMLATIEPRLMKTINGADNCSGVDDAPLVGGGITHEPVGQKWGPDAFTVIATVEPAVVAAIRQAAHRLAVPEDIAMLTILGITLAWFEGNKLEPIAMIVPQRDGPAENDMVGLFADIRHLTVHTEGMNFAGVAMHLHRIVKERLWCAPGIATQFDLALVNFEWTDFDEAHGFAQHVNLYDGNENARHPLKVAVEQPDRDTWRMRVAFHCRKFDDEQRNLFFEMFERSLHTLLEDPLKLVWPEDGYGNC